MLSKVPFTQIKDEAIQRMQNFILDRLNLLAGVPFLDGRLIADLSLSMGDNIVEHKLSREIQGYFVVSQNTAANIYDASTTGLDKTKFVTLNSSGDVTVKVWVF